MTGIRRNIAVVMAVMGVLWGIAGLVRAQTNSSGRQTIPLTDGWKFIKGDVANAQSPTFDTTAWRTVRVPHDWSIEGPFAAQNPTRGAGAFLPAGVGWYRKAFTLPVNDATRRVLVELDGVMANSEVWINGFSLGKRPNGYISLRYDLTGHLNYGPDKPNLLAVRADNANQPASRWYAGAGIYRPVRLVVTNPVFVTPDIFITTPHVSPTQATVQIQANVVNENPKETTPLSVEIRLLNEAGKTVAMAETPSQTLAAGKTRAIQQSLTVAAPQRWSIDQPALYRAVINVRSAGKTLDETTTTFGIREAHFEAATGFNLNGQNLKLKGVCLHEDGGAFGIAVPNVIWEQRLRALKAIGVNAIRTAHSPPAPEFLDLCDRYGFLVMDELFDTWTVGKEPFDYHLFFHDWSQADLRDMVLRDRNHPCVILYSAGNEIRDTPNASAAQEILSSLVAAFHRYDPTRPVTQALFRPNSSHDYDNGLADQLDVIGQNYRENELLAAHRQKPTRTIIGTENGHDRRAWLSVRDNPAFAGQFLWTGIDYLGESRRWPFVGANSGLLDRMGLPRPLAFERQSWWSETPMVYLARRIARNTQTPTDPGFEAAGQDVLRRPVVLSSDWTPQNLSPHDETVEVYSNCEQAELFLNGKSLGAKSRPADASPRVWIVPFAPGTLRAVGSNGTVRVDCERKTAGKPARIALTTDSPPGTEVAIVRATVVDADGIPVPHAPNSLTFTVTGLGRIAAVDNGDMTSHKPFQTNTITMVGGVCTAYIEPGKGTLTVTAAAPDLSPGLLTLPAR